MWNLAPFAALVFVARMAGLAGETAALGAAIFFRARVVHVAVDYAAIPWLRTLAFAVSWVGMAMIFVALVF